MARPRGLFGRPSPRAGRLYRALVALAGLIARRVLRLRLDLQGARHLPTGPDSRPAGAWIAAGMPHRTWIEPFVLAILLPVEPRLVFLGDGRAIFRTPLRRLIFRLVGGVVPIWPGGRRGAFEAHAEAVESVIRAGAVFALFPEVGPPAPLGEARPLGAGLGYFALRTGAPVVTLAFGGTDEIYLGRRIVLRVLPPSTWRELCGLPPDARPPAPETARERELAHRIVEAVRDRAASDVAEVHRLAEPPAGTTKRLRWLGRILH